MTAATAWLNASPQILSLASGETKTLNVVLSAASLESGVFEGILKLHDGTLAAEVNARMMINAGPEVALITPEDGAVFVEGDSVKLVASASDPDGIAQVQFYEGLILLGTGGADFSFLWNHPVIGKHELTVRAVDNRGAVRISNSVTIDIRSDTNHNGIGDDWEMHTSEISNKLPTVISIMTD